MKVEAFAIGFGPKIFSWVRDGVEYSFRWIPAGGFVKLPQMVTSDALEGASTSKEPIPPASPLSRILVAFAGPFMNVVFAFVIATFLYFVGLPEMVNPPVIGYVEPDSTEAQLGIKEGDRILSVNSKRVKSWQDVQTFTILARTNVLPVVIQRGDREVEYMLTAKVNELVGLKMLNLDPRDHPVIKSIESGSPAEKAGLKLDDEFISFAHVPIVSQEQLVDLIRKRTGQSSEITVKRGNEKISMTVTPHYDEKTKRGRIGVGLSPSARVVL